MEPEDQLKALQHEVRILSKKLEMSEKARKRLEDYKEQNQQVLEKVNAELNSTLQQLQTTQLQLIQSEKLAGLGQLIAGISHEINTPAAAIIGAVDEIKKDYGALFENLLVIISQLPADLHDAFLQACRWVISKKEPKGTKEERDMARGIEKVLTDHGVPSSHYACSCLAKIGYDGSQVTALIPLLKSSLGNPIQELLFMLGMNRVHLGDIEISIKRVASLVKALKLYSRSDQDEVGMANVNEDILNVLTILRTRLQGLTVTQEFGDLPPIRCYADQLNQVWTNLINNALEAQKGKGTIIIRTQKLPQGIIQVEIEDHGPGIPKEILPRIFEAYFTTKRKGEGTGLGLTLTEQIIKKHKGHIEVESQPGRTVFRVILPETL
ncbi:MAG: GHKL domain-containing protein [Parachlamydia sp.]|nr:GHKL domain-containing protein [Parachlamydia sp.]